MQLFNTRSIHPLHKIVALCLLAFFAGYVCLWLSFQYQFHNGQVNWYFPHALRVMALLVLPFRHWLLFLACSLLGSDTSYHVNFSNDPIVFSSALHSFVIYYLSESTVGALVYYLYRKQVKEWLNVKGIAWLLMLTILYRFVYLAIPAFFEIGFFAYIPADKYIEYFIAIQLSGYFVGFYLLSWVIIFKFYHSEHQQKLTLDLTQYFLVVAIFIVASICLVYIHPSLEYLLRIAVLIPLILLALFFGALGAFLTGNIVVSCLMVYLYQAPPSLLLEYQPFVIIYLLTSILVGVVMLENERIRAGLLEAQTQLRTKNTHLLDVTNKMQNLSKKVIDTQEKERKYLSQELHDEIGQNIIALKSSIYLSERAEGNSDRLSLIKENVDMMYISVYELINWLRPSVLDEFGLAKTLGGPFLKERLALSDIRYMPKINISTKLPEYIETAIFRICQEAVNNVLKHSNATLFTLELFETTKTITLILKDNGSEYDRPHLSLSGRYGLEGISDRVLSLDGSCNFSFHNGFEIMVVIPKEVSL